MTNKHAFWRHALRTLIGVAFVMIPRPSYSQVVLTGAIQFSTNSVGAASGGQIWNTLADGPHYDLWLALNPDGTSPVNGPSDAESAIVIPLVAGHAHTFYIFGQPGTGINFNGLNLFFEGNASTPGISVFGATNGSAFAPDGGTTLTLAGVAAAGSGRSFYSSGSVITVLQGYAWNAPGTPPGDVCQAFEFSPGGGQDYFGSFTLQTWPAAALTLSQISGAPVTQLTAAGSGFTPGETVDIFGGHIGIPPVIGVATADASGSFTAMGREPQHALGPMDVYALGVTSH